MRFSQLVTHYQSVIWFAAIGVCSGVVYFVTIYFLMEMLAVDYRLAVSIAYAVALAVHFFANRHIVFRARGGSLHVHLLRYSAMIVLNYLTTLLIVIGAVNIFSVSAYAGATVAIAINMIGNYVLSKYWIFRDHHATLQE